jgi:putative transposase
MSTVGLHASTHNNEQKLMTLSLDEFLRRFLLHLLPKGFVRITGFKGLDYNAPGRENQTRSRLAVQRAILNKALTDGSWPFQK